MLMINKQKILEIKATLFDFQELFTQNDKQIKEEEGKDLYVRLYKRVYNKDQLIEEKVINESYYKMKSTS